VITYVAGFALAPRSVLLVRKTHPEAIAGRWNAIGGKVEPGEQPRAAMLREFKEEAGVAAAAFGWTHFCSLRGRYPLEGGAPLDFVVEFYYARLDMEFNAYVLNDVGELLQWHTYAFAADPARVLPNVTWLLPMARSFAAGERAASFVVEEQYDAVALQPPQLAGVPSAR
jgi:8-oxo-dGTP pyrophosphatase MutT (NUDIX family)